MGKYCTPEPRPGNISLLLCNTLQKKRPGTSRHWLCSALHSAEGKACLNGHKYTTTCFLFLVYLFLLQHGCWAGSLMRKACGSRQWSTAKLRSLTWCTVSHRKDEGKEREIVQAAIKVAWGQWKGAVRRSFQTSFHHTSRDQTCLVLPSLLLAHYSEFTVCLQFSMCHCFLSPPFSPPQKMLAYVWDVLVGMSTAILSTVLAKIVSAYLEQRLWIKQFTWTHLLRCQNKTRNEVGVCMATLLILQKEDFKLKFSIATGATKRKGIHGEEKFWIAFCVLWNSSGFPGAAESSTGSLWFGQYTSCSWSLCFSIGISPSNPFTLILFHQAGGKKMANRNVNNEALIYCFHSLRLLTENMHLMDI